MDKKVLYALLGGAAVAVAAIAYSMSKGSDEATTDDIVDQLGPVERDDNGMLTFDYFLKIF
jgi:hypothetical protein